LASSRPNRLTTDANIRATISATGQAAEIADMFKYEYYMAK
jgi:hypothetical protein